jgi:membrane protein insertase Oxa1/YidC/SpoIIIJ
MNIFEHVPTFQKILGLSILGTLVSIINMNEYLRLLILGVTAISMTIKLYEQVRKTEFLQHETRSLWRKLMRKKLKEKG